MGSPVPFTVLAWVIIGATALPTRSCAASFSHTCSSSTPWCAPLSSSSSAASARPSCALVPPIGSCSSSSGASPSRTSGAESHHQAVRGPRRFTPPTSSAVFVVYA
eukprot:8049125-Alexandrium_andersonii.AAC.1